MAQLHRQVQEANPDLPPWVVPGGFPADGDRQVDAGEGERHLPRPGIFAALGELDCHPAFAQIGRDHFEGGTGRAVIECNRDLNRDPGVAAALALHEGAGSAKTGLGALGGYRLVEHEMGSHVEGGTEPGMAVHNGNRDGALVAGCVPGALQYGGRGIQVVTVDDDGFEAGAGKLADGAVGLGAVLNANVQVAQDATQEADDLLIRTQNQRLQTHGGNSCPRARPGNQPPQPWLAMPFSDSSSSLRMWATLRSCSAAFCSASICLPN